MDMLATYAEDISSNGGGTGSTIFFILTAVGLWKMFEKAREPGWAGIIPFYNMYKLCEISMGNPWYWLRLFVVVVPIIGWILYFYFSYVMGRAIARAFGQDDVWAIGYMLAGPIFYCITGFGSYSYYGPEGMGDTRTEDARQARTVDFNVVKNNSGQNQTMNDFTGYTTRQTVRDAEDVVVQKVGEPAEDVVDFTFDQPEE